MADNCNTPVLVPEIASVQILDLPETGDISGETPEPSFQVPLFAQCDGSILPSGFAILFNGQILFNGEYLFGV